MVSVVIPSYKDKYLQKTINSLIQNSCGEIEIIVVLDGYWQNIENHPYVKVLHLGKNRGMRGAINAGVAISRGEFVMRTDEHCMFDKDWDKKLTETFKDNWIVTPRRYFLDPVKWEIMDLPPVDYCKLVIRGNPPKFSAEVWKERDEELKSVMIGETMGMQGSCWIMKRSWWDKVIGELQTEGYGPLYQDSHEMVFKTWKAGGKLMLNKNTWHAHKHRDFPRTHSNGTQENPSKNEECFAYSLSVWREYFENEIKPLWNLT